MCEAPQILPIFAQMKSRTCGGHGEQQQRGWVQGLSCHEERAGVGVGPHRLRRPAEGEHQAERSGAHSHQEGNHPEDSLCFQSWKTHNKHRGLAFHL